MTSNRTPLHHPAIAICVIALLAGFAVACGSDAAKTSVVAAAASVGTPCVPPDESSSAAFSGYDEHEISIGNDAATGGPFCLVDHFRGLRTCPYGQDDTGAPPPGATRCTTSTGAPVTGTRSAGQGSAKVEAQCVDRRAADTVIWSCRCANVNGRTDDGDTYCACPGSMTCAQLVASASPGLEHLSGGFCIKNGTEYGAQSCAATCDPVAHPCP